MDPYGAHAHGQIQPERPHGIGFEGEEEHHHEKKPVLEKVKDKVKKIKNTISKKTHGHGHDHDEQTASEEEYQDDGDDVEVEEMETDPEVHGAPMYESAAAVLVTETGTGHADDHVNRGHENQGPERVSLGTVLGRSEEDPAASDSRTRTSAPSDQTKLLSSSTGSPGSDVVGVSPIIRSFQNMSVSDEPQAEKEALQSPPTGAQDQLSPESLPRRTDDEPKETDHVDEKVPTYTEKLTSTATAAKDAAASAATTVYNKVSEAGTAVMGKVQSQTGPASTAETRKATGTGMKGYLLDKLRPGDEDRALSEVISDAMHAKKQEAGEADAMHAKTQEAGEAEETVPGGGGIGVVDKIKGAVSSFLGAGRVSGSRTPLAVADDQVGEQVGSRVQEEEMKKQA